MRARQDCTAGAAPAPAGWGEEVSIVVPEDHPLRQLQEALDWEAITGVMVKHWRAAGKNVDGGPGQRWPVSFYVPLVVLMVVKRYHPRQMEVYVNESVVARVFLCQWENAQPWLRDHSNIARAYAALGAEGLEEVNQLIVGAAVALGFGDPRVLSADTTVMEPLIGYPNEPGILRGVAQRCQRALIKLKNKGAVGVEAALKQASEVLRQVKQYHLFARQKVKQEKNQLVRALVEQTQVLIQRGQDVAQRVGQSSERVIHSAAQTFNRMAEVMAVLSGQIIQWLETGVVAKGKILHAGITQARAIVKEKAGRKAQFGLKYLLNRIGGGYVFGTVVPAQANDKNMPLEALKQYRQVFGPKATPEMIVYDRGGHSDTTVKKLRREGVNKIGIQPAGQAPWLVAEDDQQRVMSQRGQTEGSIGTLKNPSYQFNHRTERTIQTLTASGQRAILSLNLNTLMRDLVAASSNTKLARV